MSMSSTLWARDQNQLPVREHLLLLLLCIDAGGGNDCEMATSTPADTARPCTPMQQGFKRLWTTSCAPA